MHVCVVININVNYKTSEVELEKSNWCSIKCYIGRKPGGCLGKAGKCKDTCYCFGVSISLSVIYPHIRTV